MFAQCNTRDPLPLFRLWQLISPSLPIGVFAYSQGLEQAVELADITDEQSACAWMRGVLTTSLAHLDVPVLRRLYEAHERADTAAIATWNEWLSCCRETRELLDEDRQVGQALARLLVTLDVAEARPWCTDTSATLAVTFSLACAHWRIPLVSAVSGYLWMWCEGQVAAAVKLVPLGQSAGQRVLTQLAAQIPAAMDVGLALGDEDIGMTIPGLALASALHETQYTRLFRS